jgi:hypothetical protein
VEERLRQGAASQILIQNRVGLVNAVSFVCWHEIALIIGILAPIESGNSPTVNRWPDCIAARRRRRRPA